MQCACGGDMLPRKAVWQQRLRLEYLVCRTCGRAGGEELFQQGQFTATGHNARRLFNKLKAESALRP